MLLVTNVYFLGKYIQGLPKNVRLQEGNSACKRIFWDTWYIISFSSGMPGKSRSVLFSYLMIEDKNKKNCKTTEISDKSELYFRNNLQICAYKLVEIF